MPFFPALLAGGHLAVLGRVFEARTRALVFGNPLGAIVCFIQCANGTRPSAAMRSFGWNAAVRSSVSGQVPDAADSTHSRRRSGICNCLNRKSVCAVFNAAARTLGDAARSAVTTVHHDRTARSVRRACRRREYDKGDEEAAEDAYQKALSMLRTEHDLGLQHQYIARLLHGMEKTRPTCPCYFRGFGWVVHPPACQAHAVAAVSAAVVARCTPYQLAECEAKAGTLR